MWVGFRWLAQGTVDILGFRECGGQSSGSTKMQGIYLPLTSILLNTLRTGDADLRF